MPGAMPAADPLLLFLCIALACAALFALRPVIAARREARRAAREARERSHRMHEAIEALRKARRDA